MIWTSNPLVHIFMDQLPTRKSSRSDLIRPANRPTSVWWSEYSRSVLYDCATGSSSRWQRFLSVTPYRNQPPPVPKSRHLWSITPQAFIFLIFHFLMQQFQDKIHRTRSPFRIFRPWVFLFVRVSSVTTLMVSIKDRQDWGYANTVPAIDWPVRSTLWGRCCEFIINRGFILIIKGYFG